MSGRQAKDLAVHDTISHTLERYSAAPIMRRPESLRVFGPRMFGINEDFRGVETLAKSNPEL